MRRSTLLIALSLWLGACQSRPAEPDRVTADSVMPETVRPLMRALGGMEAWDAMPRYLRFDFRISFNGDEFLFSENVWDRWEGRYRTRWTAAYQQGEVLGLVNVNEPGGSVWVDGQPAPTEQSEELIGAARYRATNDSYWLVAPYKLLDPGVNLTELGNVSDSSGTHRRVHLTFGDSVGTTPGDEFWLDVNARTGLLDRWAFFLESFEGEPALDQASVWRWEDWSDFGGVLLSKSRVMERSPQFPQFRSGRIDFPVLRFLDEVDDRVFTDPTYPVP